MTMTQVEADARIAKLQAELKAVRAERPRTLTFKVSEKGAVSVYGLGKFPVTLYGSQWDALLNATPSLRTFIDANRSRLTVKV